MLLGEKMEAVQLVGAAVILGGVYLTRAGYRFFIR
jgi:drug/metabolite transporter (DMT)-like permease